MPNIPVDLSGTTAWENVDYSIMPEDDYHVIICASEVKTGRVSGRQYLSVNYRVTSGRYAKRQIFDTFSLWSDNPEFSKKRFKALRQAVGLNPNIGGNTEELLGREFVAQVGIRSRYDRPEEKENFVRGYLPPQGGQSIHAPQGGQLTQGYVSTPRAQAAAPAPAPQAAPSETDESPF